MNFVWGVSKGGKRHKQRIFWSHAMLVLGRGVEYCLLLAAQHSFFILPLGSPKVATEMVLLDICPLHSTSAFPWSL